jgi:hypothetical protein
MWLATLLFAASIAAPDVHLVTDEAEAVLHVLDKRQRGEAIAEADWQRIFTSEGYVRLKAREHAMQRPFEDDAFRTFVMSDELLARRDVLRKTLAEWSHADLTRSARLAQAYLPAGTKIRATAYPVIKPRNNSFVFELESNPALFIYIEPLPRDTFEGIVAHEFHHIGYAAACHEPGATRWLTAFGEGVATIAAAGGPDGRPRIRPDALAEWDKQIGMLDANFATASKFLLAVKHHELDGDAEQKRGMELFGIVGPWYTVGWHMANVIEKELGRPALIDAMCRPSTLLATYNRAAKQRMERTHETLPLWPDELTSP